MKGTETEKGHPRHQRIIPHEEVIELWKTPKTIHVPLQDLTNVSKMATPDSDNNLRREVELESDRGNFTLNLRMSKKDPSDASVLLMLHEGTGIGEEDTRILARIDISRDK